MSSSTPKQQLLHLPTWGGRRRGAGRKPTGKRAGVAHRSRVVAPRCPLHVTLKVRRDMAPLRKKSIWQVLRRAFQKGCDRFGFCLNHFSVQGDHIHLIVEAEDARALGRGLKGLSVRIARGLNRLTGRSGQVIADRYHSRPLRTPTEVRNALAYVLGNARIHARRAGRSASSPRIDPFSSAGWFDGFAQTPPWHMVDPLPAVKPRTWLLRIGWRRLGLL